MVSTAEFSVDAETFPLGSVFTHLPDAEVELERLVPANDVVIPYVWLRDTQFDGPVMRSEHTRK
jgi:hypothetical protein